MKATPAEPAREMRVNNRAMSIRRQLPAERSRRPEFIFVSIGFIMLSGGLFLLFFGAPTDLSDRAGGDINIGARLMGLPAYLYAAWALFRQPRIFINRMLTAPIISVLSIICIVSVFWSIDPDSTLRRSILLLLTTLFGISLATRFDRKELMRLLAGTFVALSLIQLGSFIVAPQLAQHHDSHYPAIRGLFAFKNGAGRIFIIGFLSGLGLLGETDSKRLAYAAAGLSAICIAGTLSFNAILTMASIAVAYFALAMLQRLNGVVASALGAFLGVALIAGGSALEVVMSDVMGAFGKDMTLTGRDQIWSTLIPVLQERPWFGYGYEAFWTSTRGALGLNWNMGDFVPPHAHNGLLQVWSHIGLVGVALIVMQTAGTLMSRFGLLISSKKSVYRFDFCVILYVIIVNVAEQSLLAYGSVIWILFVAVCCLAPEGAPHPAALGPAPVRPQPRRRIERPVAVES